MKQFVLITITAILVFAFQNCGPVHEEALVLGSQDEVTTKSIEIFEETLYPVLKNSIPDCTSCHGGSLIGPTFISGNAVTSYTAIMNLGLVDLDSPADSKIVNKVNNHGGATLSSDAIEDVENAVFDWAEAFQAYLDSIDQ